MDEKRGKQWIEDNMQRGFDYKTIVDGFAETATVREAGDEAYFEEHDDYGMVYWMELEHIKREPRPTPDGVSYEVVTTKREVKTEDLDCVDVLIELMESVAPLEQWNVAGSNSWLI